jgi:hypothetical protein
MRTLEPSRPTARRRTLGLMVVLLGVVAPPRLAAQPSCPSGDQPSVTVTFSPGSWPEGLRDSAFADLQASLASRRIAACRAEAATPLRSLADIVITSRGTESVSVTVEIRDAVTEKRVTREIDLRNLPPDGRAFAIALGADELVWASWAEIAFGANRRRALAPPRLVREVERRVESKERLLVRLGAAVAGEHYSRGQAQLGPDVSFVLGLSRRFRLRLAGGLRQALTVEAPDGRVRATAAAMSLHLATMLHSGERVELAWMLGSRAALVRFEGKAGPAAVERDLTGLAVCAQTGLAAALHVANPFWLELGVGVGVPLRSVEATDSGRVITGVAGFEQSVILGLQGEIQ